MYGLRSLLGMAAIADAMMYNYLSKSKRSYTKASLTSKQWQKRKTRLKMQRDSRKINR